MPAPNQPRGGNRPPPVIAAQPTAPQGEPAPSVVAVALPAIVPASALVDAPSPPSEPVGGSFANARRALQSLAEAAAVPGASEAASAAQEPAKAPQYVATVRHFVGGERGYIEPGEPIAPRAEDLLVMLAQRTIREV